MKLTTLNLSFPIKIFKASVEHFTPRNSTAIEWAILAKLNQTLYKFYGQKIWKIAKYKGNIYDKESK